MVKVRFFGTVRMKIKESYIEIEANRVDRLLKTISLLTNEVTLVDLKKSIIYVNGTNIDSLKLYRTALKEGDEVQILSPVSGG